MHELLAAGHALHLETRRQKKLVCVPVLPELRARSCSQISPITRIFTVAPELISPLWEEDSAHNYSFGHRKIKLIFERESLAQDLLGEQRTYEKWDGYEQRCGETLKMSPGSQTHKSCTRVTWKQYSHQATEEIWSLFSHPQQAPYNHTDNRHIGLDVCLNHFSGKEKFRCHAEMFPN